MADGSESRSQLVGLRVPFCWHIAPSGGGLTGSAPSTQVGVLAGADVVVDGKQIEGATVTVDGRQIEGVTVTVDGRQIEGPTVTVTVDAEHVSVALVVKVAHVLEADFAEVPALVFVGDDVGVPHVVADDLAGLLCEVVLPGDVDDAVVLGTLTVVLRYISPTTQHLFSVNVALPMDSPQCRCCDTVSNESIKVAQSTYHACVMTSTSQLDRLDKTVHKELPLGQPEMEGDLGLSSKAVQNDTAGANPERGRNFE